MTEHTNLYDEELNKARHLGYQAGLEDAARMAKDRPALEPWELVDAILALGVPEPNLGVTAEAEKAIEGFVKIVERSQGGSDD